MKNLLMQLYTLLSTYGTTFRQRATNDTAFPYIVYDANITDTLFDKDETILTIDVWGDKATESAMYDIADGIRNDLKFYKHVQTEFGYNLRFLNMNPLRDPDENIKRVQLQFVMNLYIKEE